jgi:ABC-type bacteriocin/lantibiotic exporter with double-glycine peptidase domain
MLLAVCLLVVVVMGALLEMLENVLKIKNKNFIYIQYQSKVWTHLLIQGLFFVLTIFYIVDKL